MRLSHVNNPSRLILLLHHVDVLFYLDLVILLLEDLLKEQRFSNERGGV